MKELEQLRAKQAEADRLSEEHLDPMLKEAMHDIAEGWRELADDHEAMLEGRAAIKADNDSEEIAPDAEARRS